MPVFTASVELCLPLPTYAYLCILRLDHDWMVAQSPLPIRCHCNRDSVVENQLLASLFTKIFSLLKNATPETSLDDRHVYGCLISSDIWLCKADLSPIRGIKHETMNSKKCGLHMSRHIIAFIWPISAILVGICRTKL